MRVAELASEVDFDGWRKAARAFRLAGVVPADARFQVAGSEEGGSLFDREVENLGPRLRGDAREFSAPKAFVDLAQEVILHRSADRFDLMYRLLWRLRDEPDLMKVVSDRDVADALERAKNVSRASHKMKAFVRFRLVQEEADEETYVAWFEGPKQARLMIVGEQPGDHEDLAGRPFVGPAGQVLDAALEEAGIDRSDVYVTNAVKHFKHEPRGKRRLHKTPTQSEVSACRWWLDQERRLVRPKVTLALGGTAALGVLNRKVAVTQERGQPLALTDGSAAMITVHPSYLLRLPDAEAKARERAAFVRDLKVVRGLL